MPTDGPWSGTRLQSSLRCQTERKTCAQRKEEYPYQHFFFLVSFKQQNTPHHGNTKKRMLAANFTLVLEGFQPRVYPRTNSLLSMIWRKLLYVFQRVSQICLNTACPRITTELCVFFHMFGWDEGADEGQFILWHIFFTNQLVTVY